MSDNGDILVELATKVIELLIRRGEVLEEPHPLPDELNIKRGVFVTIKKRGILRGCIGTFQPTKENIAREIIDNAVSSSTRDPRFPPLSEDELNDITVSVDVLSEPEPINDIDELDPRKYGIIVQTEDGRRGLLLPDLDGVDTIEHQIDITRMKAGISPDEDIEILKFTVERHR